MNQKNLNKRQELESRKIMKRQVQGNQKSKNKGRINQLNKMALKQRKRKKNSKIQKQILRNQMTMRPNKITLKIKD